MVELTTNLRKNITVNEWARIIHSLIMMIITLTLL